MSKTQRSAKRMGRPPKPKALKQSEAVQVLLTPSERRHLAKDAKAAGRSLGGYLRELWLSQRQSLFVAWHEAGHAVVGYRLGFYGGTVTIVPDKAKGSLGSATGEGPWVCGTKDEDYIVTLYAGHAAECLRSPKPMRSYRDNETARELLKSRPKGTAKRLRAKAARLVRKNREQIEAVATALIEDKTLVEEDWDMIVSAIDEGYDWREMLASMRSSRYLVSQRRQNRKGGVKHGGRGEMKKGRR